MATAMLLVGTTEGAFVLKGDVPRTLWQVSGPFFDGWPINLVITNPTDGTLSAGGGGEWQGGGVWRAIDGGQTWELSLLANGSIDEMLRNDPDIAACMGRGPAPDAPFKGRRRRSGRWGWLGRCSIPGPSRASCIAARIAA